MKFPKFVRIRQRFDAPVIRDIPATTEAEVGRMIEETGLRPGASVAVAAGSRGIVNIGTIVKHTVAAFQKAQMRPFVVPAMGSHGGATSEGQRRILEHYGIQEAEIGCPVYSDIEPEHIAETPDGLPVYVDRNALRADHIVVVNRIKPHTDFEGNIGSGLMKMMAIGLGKQKGASYYHAAVFQYGFERMITSVARVVMEKTPIAFGIGIIENAYDETAHIVGIPKADLERKEREWFGEAKRLMAKLPFDELDVLIVDEMGKNISGTGMDTNIIGRRMQDFEAEPVSPKILRIVVRGLTEESEGNATGVGLADFTTRRLVDQINHRYTYINSITGMGPQKSRIPIFFDTDREVLEAAFSTIGMIPAAHSRAVHIRNTLHIGEVAISEKLLEAAADRDDIEVLGKTEDLVFDDTGGLAPVF
ncbi:MAG: DUF2088 domain-containing protein [candidate division Zixibacteria bacterium]|nr:DUF2088 domain-containing protein [candidate division Zixibacteria bacterium]